MKKVLFVSLLTAIAITGFSQKAKFSLGGELGLPVGDWSAGVSALVGFSGQADFNVASNFDLTLNAGYTSALAKNGGEGDGWIPVLCGAKYHFSDKLYGSAQMGISFFNYGGGESVNIFTFAPGVGYKVSDNFDLLFKYTSMSDNGYSISALGVRAAYTF